jgi:signal transduction histidine kinase
VFPVTDVSRWALPASRAVTLVALAGLAVVVALPAHRLPVVAGLVVSVGGAAYGLRFGPDQWKQRLTGLVLFAAGGVALIVADGQAPGWLACGAAIIAGLARLPQRTALFFAIPVAAATCLAPLARGDRDEVLVMAAACGAALVLGLIIGDVRMRAVSAERLLAAEQAAQHSRAQRDRLAERQRIAREIHDILAHSLSAQLVHLEGARLLMVSGRTDEALDRVERARGLARSGLEETRRALATLRGDIPPVDVVLRELAEEHRLLADAACEVTITGEPRDLSARAGLAVIRTAQEALTNVRKHAPGASVKIALRYSSGWCELHVTDTGGALEPGPLAASGGGYGLVGMRERAELIGGTLEAGPTGEGFSVLLRVPL